MQSNVLVLSVWQFMYKLCLILFISFILTGCIEADCVPDFGVTQQAIHKGIPAEDDIYSGVVSLAIRTDRDISNYCSGTLIAPNIVLTAAHCVSDTEEIPMNKLFNDGRIVVVVGSDVSDSIIYTATRLSVHPKFNFEFFEHDLAILWLEHEVPTEYATPIPILENSEVILSHKSNHERFETVGYGIDDDDVDGVRLRTEGVIYDYCYIGEKFCTVDAYSISIPEGALLQNLEKGGPCIGDSGGPLLVDIDGQKHVMAVISYGDANCERYSVSTTIPDHFSWINRQIDLEDSDGDDCSANPISTPISIKLIPFFILLIFLYCLRRRKNIAL